MLRVTDLEVLWPKMATACGAAAGSVATAAVMVGDFALQVLGVPLPVVISSAAGAGLARSFMEPVGFLRAVLLTGLWAVMGCAGAPMAQSIGPAIAQAVFNREMTLPANTLAALGAMIASAPWWWPKVWPAVSAWLAARRGGSGGKNDGGGNG